MSRVFRLIVFYVSIENDNKISEPKALRKKVATYLNKTMDKTENLLEKIRGLMSCQDKENIFYIPVNGE